MGNSLVFFGQLLYDKNEYDPKRQKPAGQIHLKNLNKGGTFMAMRVVPASGLEKIFLDGGRGDGVI